MLRLATLLLGSALVVQTLHAADVDLDSYRQKCEAGIKGIDATHEATKSWRRSLISCSGSSRSSGDFDDSSVHLSGATITCHSDNCW